jgi:uncharacterized lipoprotein NlpE involved in copper resistance
MRTLALIAVLSIVGCAHKSAKDVVTTIAEAGTCVASDYDEISNAILGGGANWFSIVAELLPCVGKVVADIFATVNAAQTAQLGGEVTPPQYNGKKISKRAIRRLKTSSRFYDKITGAPTAARLTNVAP